MERFPLINSGSGNIALHAVGIIDVIAADQNKNASLLMCLKELILDGTIELLQDFAVAHFLGTQPTKNSTRA